MPEQGSPPRTSQYRGGKGERMERLVGAINKRMNRTQKVTKRGKKLASDRYARGKTPPYNRSQCPERDAKSKACHRIGHFQAVCR